jgi:glycosyltransferase involved in cell wall biosynthesis
LLSSHAVPSVLNQTHRNLDIIVVGDHCTDDTELKMKKFRDSRIRFINLPKQGDYPKIDIWRWLVAGVDPVNVGLEMARGEWIANLDDDTVFSPNHIESLLKFALESNYELVHGLLGEKIDASRWIYRGRPYRIINCTALYKNYLKLFKYDPNCWKLNEPADFNRWKRMILAEVRIGFSGKDCGVCPLAKQQSRYTKQG